MHTQIIWLNMFISFSIIIIIHFIEFGCKMPSPPLPNNFSIGEKLNLRGGGKYHSILNIN